MRRSCRALSVLIFAGAIAHASLTVTWNTHRAGPAAHADVRQGVVTAVTANHVILRLNDGTLARYPATPAQTRLLQRLIGTTIRYRVQQTDAPQKR